MSSSKTENKIVKGGKFAVECVSNDMFLKNVFSNFVSFFRRKIRKFDEILEKNGFGEKTVSDH